MKVTWHFPSANGAAALPWRGQHDASSRAVPMDIDLARTFLEIVRLGSLMAAAEKLHVTQTAITARVQKLESHLNCKLFVRNRTGARLTPDGEAFILFANQLVQTWDAARRDLPLPDGYHHVLRIGAQMSLCNPLMLNWVREIKRVIPDHALQAEVKDDDVLMKDVERGVLDAALVYQPAYWPGVQVEELLEEKLILVRVVDRPEPYVYIDWGPAFRQQHDDAMPERSKAAVAFNLGPFALQYILDNGGSGYFRTRVVQSYLDRGIVERVPMAPEFSYPTYLIYSRDNPSPTLQQACDLLRDIVEQEGDWSQRWDPLI
jgi:DNA-binding transcriptional LysR family regulator